jgi:hypothetical protein
VFTLPFEAKVTIVKAIGKEGENTLRVQLVAGAEDALLQVDTVGQACRQAYKLVRGNKTGTIPVKMPARWLCKMKLIWEDSAGKKRTMDLKHVVPVKLSIVSVEKETEPPKVRLDLNVEYGNEQEALHVLHAYKRQVTADIHPADGKGIPLIESKKAGNGKTKAKPKPEATAPA